MVAGRDALQPIREGDGGGFHIKSLELAMGHGGARPAEIVLSP